MESSPAAKTGKGATFTYLLGAFAIFAVVLTVIQAFNGPKPEDPRAGDRTLFSAEINQAQKEIMAKTGLTDKTKAPILYAKTAETLKGRVPAVSKMVIPGTPTQLKAAPAAPLAPLPVPTAPAAK